MPGAKRLSEVQDLIFQTFGQKSLFKCMGERNTFFPWICYVHNAPTQILTCTVVLVTKIKLHSLKVRSRRCSPTSASTFSVKHHSLLWLKLFLELLTFSSSWACSDLPVTQIYQTYCAKFPFVCLLKLSASRHERVSCRSRRVTRRPRKCLLFYVLELTLQWS